MDDMLHIRMLGEFTITYRGREISDKANRSKKVWTLLKYLIAFHDKKISQSAMIDLLWPDGENDNPANSLKTLLHRTRALLEELHYPETKMILHKNDSFSWNNELRFDIDVEIFEDICKKAADTSLPEDERIELSMQAFSMYKGEYLPKNNCDTWVISLSTYYQSLYSKLVYSLCEMLSQKKMYSKIVDVCSVASLIDPYDEHLHYLLIDTLARSGKQKQAIKKYESVLALFYDKFGLTPSKTLTNLYQSIVKTEKATETDLNIIINDLREAEIPRGAYQCDYSVFQSLYRVEARAAARSGLSVYLCLITIDTAEKKDSYSLMAKAMSRMSDIIFAALRSGDVYSRYSVNQYIIMLPTTSYENSVQIGERILKRFDAERPRYNVKISYSLKNLVPSEASLFEK